MNCFARYLSEVYEEKLLDISLIYESPNTETRRLDKLLGEKAEISA